MKKKIIGALLLIIVSVAFLVGKNSVLKADSKETVETYCEKNGIELKDKELSFSMDFSKDGMDYSAEVQASSKISSDDQTIVGVDEADAIEVSSAQLTPEDKTVVEAFFKIEDIDSIESYDDVDEIYIYGKKQNNIDITIKKTTFGSDENIRKNYILDSSIVDKSVVECNGLNFLEVKLSDGSYRYVYVDKDSQSIYFVTTSTI